MDKEGFVINILGASYGVKFRTEELFPKLKLLEADGLCELYSKDIIIRDYSNEQTGKEFDNFEEYEKKVLRHELFHALFFEAGLNNYCEDELLVNLASNTGAKDNKDTQRSRKLVIWIISLKKQEFKFKPFSLKQKKVLTWWTEDSPCKDKDGIICDGSIRSGKTLIVSLSFVMWAMKSFNNTSFAIAGKTIGSLKRNVLLPLRLMLATMRYKVKFNRSENYLEISKNGHKNIFFLFGGKDESSQDLIAGITLAGILFDEVTLMPESFVNQASARCSTEGSKIWMTCNPDKSPKHYIKAKWIDKAGEKNLLYIHFVMKDNPSLGAKVLARYERMYTGIFYKRYVKGLWVAASGLIYGSAFDEDKHIFKGPININDYSVFYASCDYGVQNAMIFQLWGLNKKLLCFDCIREYCYSGRDTEIEKDDGQYYADMEAFFDGITPSQIIIDPSASSYRTLIKNKRRYIPKKAKNAVYEGIRRTSQALHCGAIRVHESCANMVYEFPVYSWDEKKSLAGKEEPLKESDHSMDALRYFVNTILFKRYERLLFMARKKKI